MWTEEEFYKYKGNDEFLEVSYYGKATVRKHKKYSEYVECYIQYQKQENLNEYNNNLDNLAYEVRKQLKDKIEKSVWDNQKCFIDLWKKENPDVAMNDIVMYHSFDESGKYKFWVEMKEKSE